METTSRLENILRDLRPVWMMVGVTSFFINLLILPISLYSLQVMDRVLNTGSMATLLWLTLIMLAMFAVAGVLQALRSMILQRAADWIHTSISDVALPIVLTQTAAGNKGAQHLRDAASIKQFVGGNGVVTIIDMPWSLLYIAALFVVHWALGLLVIVGALLLLLLAWLNEISVKRPNQEASLRSIKSMQELEMATRNAEVIEAMGMSTALAKRWKTMQEVTTSLQVVAGNRAAGVQGVTKFVRLSLQILVTCLSAWLAVYGYVTAGAIVASAILSSRALAPFEVAISSWKSFADARGAYSRIKKVFAVGNVREDGIDLPRPEGFLSVEKLSYSVSGREEPILNNISFSLNAGEVLAVIGANGSGKSTLLRLILSIFPASEGVVRLDGADVAHWPRVQFGKLVGYLPQDVELFAGTVKDNIARFNHDAKAEDIIRAAQIAGAHDLILRLPKGYETEIGQNGALLSAGQRQRIGLARAFYGMPQLMVLDEPDANLDDIGQNALVASLQYAKQQKITIIIVTHNNRILSHVDKILVLREGSIESFGNAREVIQAYTSRQKQKLEQV